jgi:hypothetical protein
MSEECALCHNSGKRPVFDPENRQWGLVACKEPECVDRDIRRGAVALLAAEAPEGIQGATGATGRPGRWGCPAQSARRDPQAASSGRTAWASGRHKPP